MCLVMSIRVHFGDGNGDEDELGNCFFDHLPIVERLRYVRDRHMQDLDVLMTARESQECFIDT